MIIIEEMNEADIDRFAEIDQKCFTVPWSRKAFEDEFKNSIAVYFAARNDNECIGYAGFWNVSGEGDITNVAVVEEHRRSGVGSMLIEAVLERAKQLNIDIMTLEVRQSNYKAQGLYKKYGFEVIGTRKRYYSDNNEDALIMTKQL
ncbi:MAG: ribosomal protein S18-alanine N-acetyltransferase [Clostridia bacterium]|nr:ribosomal protein S18-alanine N-acetyltransferase [Clostridia bacterium]